MKPCPYCREEIQEEAIKCRFCSTLLVPIDDRYRVNYILDRDLIRFVKIAGTAVFLFATVGIFLWGFNLKQIGKEIQTARDEVRENRKVVQMHRDETSNLVDQTRTLAKNTLSHSKAVELAKTKAEQSAKEAKSLKSNVEEYLEAAETGVKDIEHARREARSLATPRTESIEERLKDLLPRYLENVLTVEQVKKLRENFISGTPFNSVRVDASLRFQTAQRKVAPSGESRLNITPVLPTSLTVPAMSSVEIAKDQPVPTSSTKVKTSTITTPSLGVRGSEIVLTGNWFAAVSNNAGSDFDLLDPFSVFPKVNRGFCCSQDVLYDSEHDLMFWVLQYQRDGQQNTLRLVMTEGRNIRSASWKFYDLTPKGVGNWELAFFDLPKLAVSSNNLYITTNLFDAERGVFINSLILRIPLEVFLTPNSTAVAHYFASTEAFNFRATQGSTDTIYWAAYTPTPHKELETLRVFSWPENSDLVTTQDIRIQKTLKGNFSAPGPNGHRWLTRIDTRMSAAWEGGSDIGFAWSAPGDASFPFPHIRVVILDKYTKALVAQPHIWNPQFAFAFPAIATNSDGVVGVSLFYGGDPWYPSHAVGVLKQTEAGALLWELVPTVKGTNGPANGKFGDSLAVRRHGIDPKTWVTAAFTLQGGSSSQDVEVRYIHFRLRE